MVGALVERYQQSAAQMKAHDSDFTEADTRSQFLDPLLRALGWDVTNESGLSTSRMEVVLERTGKDSDAALGRPDYRLRLNGEDVLPFEAKKPNVPVSSHAKSAIQARRYGWTLGLPASVLSNFDELLVFDSTIEPKDTDDAQVALRPSGHFRCKDYLDRFDDLWDLLSHESLSTRGIEDVYDYKLPPRGESPFDTRFLESFRKWRFTLAKDVAARNPELTAAEVGRRVQRILNALLFLRICEDRRITRYQSLLRSATSSSIVDAFRKADQSFNAGLFTVLNQTNVTPEALATVVRSMYWPESQFAFGVMEPEILAGVYEQYLAEQISIDDKRQVSVEQKPEVAHAGGIVTTPGYIVSEIVDATIAPQLRTGIPSKYSVLDLAVGSGVFLLEVFKRLIDTTEAIAGSVDLATRASIATKHLFGVDIDGAAVEVARLSLLLTILGEDDLDLATASKVLPDLSSNIVWGNSVVKQDFDSINPEAAADITLRTRTNPLNLRVAFGSKYPSGGFSAIVGNPPYIRIQVLSEHFPEMLAYLQDPASDYESSKSYNFDIYMVFTERAMDLLSPQGRLGFIIPQRFTNLLSASPVRSRLSSRIEKLIHFGEEQVFPGRTTYTAIAIAGPKTSSPVELELVDDLERWRQDRESTKTSVDRAQFSAAQWPIQTADQSLVFDQLRQNAIAELGDHEWVHIFVGVQTSADKLYFIQPENSDDPDLVVFTDCTGIRTVIERSILRPAILDQSISFIDGQPENDYFAIFPYKSSGKSAKERLIQPDEMRSTYPRAYDYFARHRDRLAQRKISPDPGAAFWAYGRSQSITALDDPKLVVRVLSLSPQYALDSSGLVVPGGGDGGPYYLLRPRPSCPYSIGVIQAILSHPIVDLFVSVTGKKYRGSYASHRKAFLEKVPVPNLDAQDQVEIDESVERLRDLAVQLRSETDTARLRAIKDLQRYLADRVEAIVSRAYGLDSDLVDRVVGRAT